MIRGSKNLRRAINGLTLSTSSKKTKEQTLKYLGVKINCIQQIREKSSLKNNLKSLKIKIVIHKKIVLSTETRRLKKRFDFIN